MWCLYSSICPGQNSQNLDSLFTGNFLGHKSGGTLLLSPRSVLAAPEFLSQSGHPPPCSTCADIADGSLRHTEFRTFNNIVGDYYVSPIFLERVAVSVWL